MGKLISEESKELFPITTIAGLIHLFENDFLNTGEDKEPNLALLSIILGTVEHSLVISSGTPHTGTAHLKKHYRSSKLMKKLIHTSPNSPLSDDGRTDLEYDGSNNNANGAEKSVTDFPPLEYDTVLGLYEKLYAILITSISTETLVRDRHSPDGTSRGLINSISDVFWNTLSRSYCSDKPHLQSLYAYLTGLKLDSFGLALAVVASCQLLGLPDVHLVLSEDHAWVSFGKGNKAGSTVEVTWHGKGHEDKRGRPIEDNLSWLYLRGSSILCTRWTEIVAIVAAINPSVSGASDSLEMGIIQQKLLWKLYQTGHLQKYPMAIDHLADMEEICSTVTNKSCAELYEEAISSSKRFYKDMHVYPYIYYGGYLYRREDFKGALKCWADAAQVISNYRYSKLDEEIYKEFMEISRELLTPMMKKCSTGFSANSPIRDPTCYANLLRFFDGICLWEELGSTPVLHITWAQTWISALGKFESTAREGVKLLDYVSPIQPCDEEGPMICDTLTPKENISTSAGAGIMDFNGNSEENIMDDDEPKLVHVYLKSFKMKNIKALLQKDKFNPATLSLQLTAQPSLLISESAGIKNDRPRPFSGRIRGKVKPRNQQNLLGEEYSMVKKKRISLN